MEATFWSAIDLESEEKTISYGRASVDPKGRILSAAKKLFFTEGFDRVSVERLAKEASVSKTTLYKYYGDMPGVLKAIAESEADQLDFSVGADEQSAKDIEDRLIDLGARLLKEIDAPEKVQFDRLVHEQARHYPDLAEVYYGALYARTQNYLSALIALGQKKGLFRSNVSSDLLADQLLSMWLGLNRTRTLLGIVHPTKTDYPERSRQAIQTLATE
ncbi:TetR/AcrR family transcriptional regulator [Roseibium alexandrii]|uniref:TetR/AcrR family transcriptional regulator n=1 Tax=Roseibium alexandrii TaxID=388408 RepID=UPI003753D469